MKIVLAVCISFWSLTKGAQDSLLLVKHYVVVDRCCVMLCFIVWY